MGELLNIAAEDERWLRVAITVARRARSSGNAPFGAVLVSAAGHLLLESENTVLTTRDVTGHAELNAVREATQRFDPETLAGATLYASTEPCPMCAGAIFWAGIGRVVFGLSSARLTAAFDPEQTQPRLSLHGHELLSQATRPIVVLGPLLEDEALAVFQG
jgi:tRNA(Arg) A34 adenosine deaminase TadA